MFGSLKGRPFGSFTLLPRSESLKREDKMSVKRRMVLSKLLSRVWTKGLNLFGASVLVAMWPAR